MKFKVGDEVVVVKARIISEQYRIGMIGRISEITGDNVYVDVHKKDGEYYYFIYSKNDNREPLVLKKMYESPLWKALE